MFRKKRKQIGIRKIKRTKRSFSHINKTNRIKRKPKSKINKILLYLTLVLIAFSAIIYLLFFSKIFELRKIIIKNLDSEISSEIEKIAYENINKNMFSLNTEIIEDKIKFRFTEIKNIEIKKQYPQSIVINFEEFPNVANIINETKSIKKSYIINNIGYVVKEDTQNKNLPFIKIKTDEELNKESQILTEEKVEYIINSIKYFEDKFGIKVTETEYKINAREIHLLTEKGFYIWIDTNQSYEEQFNKLKKVLIKLDIYNEPLAYIDLRIEGFNGEKIIYKRK